MRPSPNPEPAPPRSLAFMVVASLCYIGACAERPDKHAQMQPVYSDASFDDLLGWAGDDHGGALSAMILSCPHLERHGLPSFGTPSVWREICSDARENIQSKAGNAKQFFERNFRPLAISGPAGSEGLITGYFEPELRGSRTRDTRFNVPLHVRPPDLVSINLARFSNDLKGRRISGRIIGGSLVPYYDRVRIENGVLEGKKLELVWVDSLVDAFFLHIQGSGRIKLRNGQMIRLGYAGTNGRPYTAIGRELIRRGVLSRKETSMQTIRKWLKQNPAGGIKLMQTNESYVFFRELRGPGPVGALGVALTPERSLAIDRRLLPLGLPIWLETTLPGGTPFRRLMVAQDTGGAIQGVVRADVFWGSGTRARNVAGEMKSRGKYWLLVPHEREPKS